MGRLIAHGIAVSVVLVCATVAHADEDSVPADIATIANEFGIDQMKLWGATLATNMDPRSYLCAVGEGPCPKPPAPAFPFGVWDLLHGCEARSGGWSTNTGNGYYGGLQEDMTFWINYGGRAFAPRPDLATREQQIVVAQRGLAVQGWGAWPVCSRRLGLR